MAERMNTSPVSRSPRLRRREYRRKVGVSLEQIATDTKISIRFLQAIEAEEFDGLPGGVFRTSYIRQYAAAIGFNEDRLLACYRACTASTGLDLSTPLSGQSPANGKGRSFVSHWFRVLDPTRFL